jgi:hypothetical protein
MPNAFDDDDLMELPTSGAKTKSYKDGQTSQTLEFLCTGPGFADDVETLLFAGVDGVSAPIVTGTAPPLRIQGLTITPIEDNVWQASVSYESEVSPTTGWSFSGQTTGGSTKVTQGLAVTSYGTSPPNMQGAINVTANGVEGVDIVIPALEFSITKSQSAGTVSLAYVATLTNMTGTTNNASFNGFAAGELLFLGADFSQSSEGECSVTYKFVASPNQTGLTVGSISGIAKKGHEYMWVLYEAFEDATNKAVVRRPRAVYVHRVYRESNFASLQI